MLSKYYGNTNLKSVLNYFCTNERNNTNTTHSNSNVCKHNNI